MNNSASYDYHHVVWRSLQDCAALLAQGDHSSMLSIYLPKSNLIQELDLLFQSRVDVCTNYALVLEECNVLIERHWSMLYSPGTDRNLLMTSAKFGRITCFQSILQQIQSDFQQLIQSPLLQSIIMSNHDLDEGGIMQSWFTIVWKCRSGKGGNTALHYACYNNNLQIALEILQQSSGTICLTMLNTLQETPLHSAMIKQHVELVNGIKQSEYFKPSMESLPLTLSSTSHIINKALALEVVDVLKGGDKKVVGQRCSCLKKEAHRVTSLLKLEDLYIGRSKDNDWMLLELSLSKSHAVLSYFPDEGFIIRDLNSKHGTFVWREQTWQTVEVASRGLVVQEGDLIRLGSIVLQVIAQDPIVK